DSSQLELGLRIAYQREPSIRHSSSQYTFTSRLRYTTGHLRRETRTLCSLPVRRVQRRVRRPEREFHRNLCASEIAAATGRAVIPQRRFARTLGSSVACYTATITQRSCRVRGCKSEK